MANQQTNADLNLEDPSTWPNDVESLERLAISDGESEPDKTPAVEEPEQEVKQTETTKEHVSEGDGDVVGTADVTKDGETEPEGVQTRDGRNVIPFNVLQDMRERAARAEQQAKEAMEEIARLRGDAPSASETSAHEAQSEATTPYDANIADIKEQMKEEEDDPSLERILKRELAALESQRSDYVKQQEAQALREQQEASLEEREIQTALDNSPLLTAWGADQDKTWHRRSTALHRHLLETDEGYAGLPLAKQFDVLPEKVSALYGESPHAQALAATRAAKPKARERGYNGPTSLSQIPAGDVGEDSELAGLEKMPSATLQGKLNKLAAEGKLDDWLAGIS